MGHFLSTVFNLMKHHEYISDVSPLGACAHRIYNHCIDWFGPPADGEQCIEYVIGKPYFQNYTRLTNMYLLVIDSRNPIYEKQVLEVSYLTYQRFAQPKNKKFLITIPVSFIMQQTLGVRILREEGFCDYADYLDNLAKETPFLEGAFTDYEDWKRKKNKMPFRAQFDADKEKEPTVARYVKQAAKIGFEIERLIGWEKLCSIIRYGSITEWIQSLPENVQKEVSMYMGCATPKM